MSRGKCYGRGEVSDTVLADIERRFAGFAVPEGIFDPSTATADQLMQFGLPPKPDPECQPLLRRAWDIGFGKPLRLQPFEVERDLVEQAEYRLFEKNVANISFDGNNFEISSNWSGAYITANQDKHFLQIWGTWTIPGNLQVPPQRLQGPTGIPYVCANWIGLDGQRLYLEFITAPNGHRVSAATRQHHDGAGMDAVVGERQRRSSPGATRVFRRARRQDTQRADGG